MKTIRRKPARAGAAAATLLIAVCMALPSPAMAEGPEGPTPPHLSFDPPSYEFGVLPVNSDSALASLQLRNDGETATPVTLDVVGGSGTFRIGGSDCSGRTLNPGESCLVQVEFRPYNAMPFEAQLRAVAEGGTAFTAGLHGEGGRAIFTPATDPANFGSVPVGSEGVTQTIDVTNTGSAPGGAFIAVISGGAIGSFHLLDENCTGFLLSPGSTCNLQVSFQPLSTGAKTARLSLFGEQDGGTQILLSGIGLEPELEPEPVESAPSDLLPGRANPKRRARSKLHRHRLRRRLHRANVASRRPLR
jgi:hypothetical protein